MTEPALVWVPGRSGSGVDTSTATIFVRLPAYRDPECLPTIERLFERADHPERVRVGVCWQYGPDEAPLKIPLPLADRVRVIDVPAAESRGASWAKSRAEGLMGRADYALFVDAHTQPGIGWDVALLEAWAACDDARAVLSAPPAGYKPPDLLRVDTRPGYRRPNTFGDDGLLTLRTSFFDGFPERPVPVAFAVGRFVFGPAKMVREVPADPHLYHHEEDLTLSARLYTHGWNLYAPVDVLFWHLYNDDGASRPLHWKEHARWRDLRKASRTRARILLGVDTPKAHERSPIAARYGLGDARSLAEFAAYSGVDLSAGQAVEDAESCAFVEAVRAESAVEAYWIAPPAPPAPSSEGDTAPPGLAVGDFAPFIHLPTTNGRTAELHLYAGEPSALFFVPAGAPATEPFLRLLESRARDLLAARVKVIVVGVGRPSTLKSLRQRVRLTAPVWVDAHGEVARAFGTGQHGERAFLLDRGLRVAAIATGAGPGAIQAMIDGAARLPQPGEPRTIAPHPPVLVVPDVIDADLRAELIALWSGGKQFQGRTGYGDGSKVRLGAKMRTDVQVPPAMRRRLDAVLLGRLAPEVEKVFGFRPTRREAYKIGCYPAETGGFFNQHRDNFEPGLAHRRVAMTLNLTDDFGGGRLVFPEYGVDGYKPTAGTAVIFPCALMHRVDPVTSGRRFTLVSFFYGEADAGLRRQLRPVLGLPPIKTDRRFRAPRPGHITHHEDARARGPLPIGDAPPRPVTLADARTPTGPETGRMRADVPPGLLVVDNYLHPDACRRITEYALSAPGTPLKVLDHKKSTAGKVVTRASDKRVTEKVKIDGISTEMLALFLDVYGHRLEAHYGVEFEWFERPQILRYPPGGLYEPHADAEHWDKAKKAFVRAQDRDYSVLVYVNDGYEGGAIEFPKLGFTVQPEPGMLVAFPSDHRYEHAARPTTSGTRIAVVSWAKVKGTRRVRKKAPFGAVIMRPR